MAFGEIVDSSTAKVIRNMLEAGMRKRVVAELAETSVSSVMRVRMHADDNGAVRDPKTGAGRRHDPRWHFGGIAGVSNTALLDRVASRMDASSTHEEIFYEYVKWCPQPAPKPSTVSEQLLKLGFTTKRLNSCNPDRDDARCAAWYVSMPAALPTGDNAAGRPCGSHVGRSPVSAHGPQRAACGRESVTGELTCRVCGVFGLEICKRFGLHTDARPHSTLECSAFADGVA